jgi:hypothetical protein
MATLQRPARRSTTRARLRAATARFRCSCTARPALSKPPTREESAPPHSRRSTAGISIVKMPIAVAAKKLLNDLPDRILHLPLAIEDCHHQMPIGPLVTGLPSGSARASATADTAREIKWLDE